MSGQSPFVAVCQVVVLAGHGESWGGAVGYRSLPASTAADFECDPPGLVTAEEALELSWKLVHASVGAGGRFSRFAWFLQHKAATEPG